MGADSEAGLSCGCPVLEKWRSPSGTCCKSHIYSRKQWARGRLPPTPTPSPEVQTRGGLPMALPEVRRCPIVRVLRNTKTTEGEATCPGPHDCLSPCPKPGSLGPRLNKGLLGHPQLTTVVLPPALPIGADSRAGNKLGEVRRPPSKGVGGPSALLVGAAGGRAPRPPHPQVLSCFLEDTGCGRLLGSRASRPFPSSFPGET